MKLLSRILVVTIAVLHFMVSQTPKSYTLTTATTDGSSQLPTSNVITDIVTQGDIVWLGTGKGLSRSTDGGRTWKNYYNTPEFGTEDISALAIRGNEIWVATAHSVEKNDQSLPEGSGFRVSTDGGNSWKVLPQPLDNYNVDTINYNAKSFIRALGITTPINNITYDIAITDSAVWITSFAGMARKWNRTTEQWELVVIPPDNLASISRNDSLRFDLSPSGGALGLQNNLNHRAFSVLAENDSNIWIGTAGGINKTTDAGFSWTKYSFSSGNPNSISGNFIVAIGKQELNGKKFIWASANPTTEDEKRSVTFTEDGGITWKQTLLGEFAHNFGFKNDIVYVPTDNGIFRSNDFGTSWIKSGTIYDASNRQRYTQTEFYSAASQGDTVWFGGVDGTIKTIDNAAHPFGSNWNIIHASQSLPSHSDTYAYPNPFAPDDEIVRIHYSSGSSITSVVTLRIFDFGMNLVRTVVQNVLREADREHDEIWDGRDSKNAYVTNGVYFYQLIIDNNEPRWGKILVIQ